MTFRRPIPHTNRLSISSPIPRSVGHLPYCMSAHPSNRRIPNFGMASASCMTDTAPWTTLKRRLRLSLKWIKVSCFPPSPWHLLCTHDAELDFDKANEILFRLGIIYKQQGKYEESLSCFDRILRNPPSPLAHADIWFQIGHVYEQQNDVNIFPLCLNLLSSS